MARLHIHLDESGNFVFSPKGTPYYIFTAVWTYNPNPLADVLSRMRYRLIKEGHLRPGVIDDLSGFHACDDPTPRRDVFVQEILAHRDWNFASLVVEKNRVNDTLYEPEKFYPKFLTMVLNFVLRGRVRPGTNLVLVYTDTLPMKKKEASAVNGTIKASCQRELKGVPFRILHHSSESNYWIQIADYCSWAMNRKWQFNDTSYYDKLWPRLAAREIAPMGKGDGTIYYRMG